MDKGRKGRSSGRGRAGNSGGNKRLTRGKGWSVVNDAVCSRFRIGHAGSRFDRHRGNGKPNNQPKRDKCRYRAWRI